MAGIERGTPDVSIAREMDTPLHRVLLSGLVYARARLTAGPCLNRRGEAHTGRRDVWVFTLDIIDFVFLFVVIQVNFTLRSSPASSSSSTDPDEIV